jgi:Zn-dependent protease
MVFGWAKPVPVNPYNLRHPQKDMVWVSLAGPGANLAAALACGLLLRLLGAFGLAPQGLLFPVYALLMYGLLLNSVLAVFNLIPIPPLDGSKVLAGFLPYRLYVEYMKLERYGMFIIIGLLLLGQVMGIHILGTIILPALNLLVRLFAGIDLGSF